MSWTKNPTTDTPHTAKAPMVVFAIGGVLALIGDPVLEAILEKSIALSEVGYALLAAAVGNGIAMFKRA